jgi:alkylation response protein AidB-like acyl-CoA dehydrogenase
MDHRLSEEYASLRATVEEFAHDVVAPKIGAFYEREEFPYEIVAQMGRMGLFGLPFPEEYGGMGGDSSDGPGPAEGQQRPDRRHAGRAGGRRCVTPAVAQIIQNTVASLHSAVTGPAAQAPFGPAAGWHRLSAP